jgi:hypothetical protein
MNGFLKTEQNINTGKREQFATIHANSYEIGEVRTALIKAHIVLSQAYSASDDRDEQRELISAQTTLHALERAFSGKSTAF